MTAPRPVDSEPEAAACFALMRQLRPNLATAAEFVARLPVDCRDLPTYPVTMASGRSLAASASCSWDRPSARCRAMYRASGTWASV